MITEDKVAEIFCLADDFCKVFDAQKKRNTSEIVKNISGQISEVTGDSREAYVCKLCD